MLKVSPAIHVDAAPGTVDLVRDLIPRRGWVGSVETAVMDGRDLKFRDATFDAGFTNFGIFFLPDLVKGGAELYRTLKPGREGGKQRS